MNKKITIAVALALSSQAFAKDTVLPTVDVKADTLIDATSSSLSSDAPSTGIPADGGEWILQVPGVSGVKMGGHGIDPVIRGQKHNQLNILLDGAYVHGGCPNRMDPPTSYASAELYDEVTVLKGVQTLIYGSGGSGGTVLFDRKAPTFEEGQKIKGKYGLSYRTSGNAWDAFADVAAGSNEKYIRGTISNKEAGEYEDANGDDVRSGYKEKSANVSLGMRTAGGTHVSLDLDAVRGEDILYAGALMDAPESEEDSVKLKIETAMVGAFEQVKIEAYRTDVYHLMDNYTLRDIPNPDFEVPSDSVTDGARITGDVALGKGSLTLGIDMQKSDRDATRYTSTGMVQSYLWPGVEIEQTGVFAEYNGELGKDTRYTAGLRYDSIDSSASKTTLSAMGTSPDDLYDDYYGITAEDKSENNVSGLYRMEHDLDKQTTMFWGISRTVRAADATERYIAANMGMTPMIWVGNPDIESEKHNQVDIGVTARGKNSSLSVSVYFDKVSDYILRDRAHGQDGILLADNATIYRNVDAELFGIDLESNHKLTNNWQSRYTLAYVRANNETDGRPIAQTPPLEGTAALEYHATGWMFGGEIRAVATQSRVDDNMMTGSGLDFGETPGFTILNLYGSVQLSKQSELKYGMDNVFDKLYAEHLNKPNAFDPSPIQVNEPGRTLWARLNLDF